MLPHGVQVFEEQDGDAEIPRGVAKQTVEAN
jgi:hypothetical protein